MVSNELITEIENNCNDSPFYNLLGFKLVEVKEGEATLEVDAGEDLLNYFGILHGGATASLVDSVMGVAVRTLGKTSVTVEMKLNYLRPIKPFKKITAMSKVIKKGKNLIVVEADVFQEDNLVAKSLGTYFNID